MGHGTRRRYGTGRDALVRAAVGVVARYGLRGLTFRRVADEAQVNNSLVAHHFGSRDALIAAALEYAVNTALEDTHLAAFGESEDEFQDALWTTLTEQLELHAFQFEMVLEAGRDESLRSLVRAIYERYDLVLQRSLFSHGDADPAAARAIFASIDGLVLQFVGGAISKTELQEALSALWALTARIRSSA